MSISIFNKNHGIRLSSKRERQDSQGFTIVELLIATAVFSVIMILLTLGIIQLSNAYYKGVTTTDTQNSARNVLSAISQSIEFSGGQVGTTISTPAAGQTYAFCVGSEAYYYQLGEEVVSTPSSGQAYHGLVSVNGDPACPILPPSNPFTPNTGYDFGSLTNGNNIPVGGQELLGYKMRLSKLSVTYDQGSGLYEIDVRVVYGDNDLLCNNTADPGSCATTTTMNKASDYLGDVVCRGGVGQQFCSTAELQSSIEKRVN